MAKLIDGNDIAREWLQKLNEVKKPGKIISWYDTNQPGSRLYTKIKEKQAKNLGWDWESRQVTSNFNTRKEITAANRDEKVSGMLLQLPLFDKRQTARLISLMETEKDIDGMKSKSVFTAPAARAVEQILARENLLTPGVKMVVLGAKGFTGRKIFNYLSGQADVIGWDKEEFNENRLQTFEVVIACTGQAEWIDPVWLKEGAALIDLGYPKGEFPIEARTKAGIVTPVPGGIGPITVAMLMANAGGI